MPEQLKNVFVSHIHEDDEGLGRLKELLAKGGFQIRDASITADKPNEAVCPGKEIQSLTRAVNSCSRCGT
jgi:hypothetical protein